MKLWLALLLAFFRPGVDEGGDENVDVNEIVDESGDGGDEGADDDVGGDAGDSGDDGKKAAAQEEAERRATADRERTDRLERENVELRARLTPNKDLQSEQEDAILNDPKADALQKWQIQANRELRAGRTTAQQALLQAQDVNDRTAYAGIAMTDPTAKKYETRVEKELADMRAKGQNASREAIYTYLLGKDMREGKFKKKAAPSGGDGKQTVARGKLPGARSDVRGNGSLTEREKRAKRLENVQI